MSPPPPPLADSCPRASVSGPPCPGTSCPGVLRAGPLLAEARLWTEHAAAHGLPWSLATAKVFDALALSLRGPDRLGRAELRVPSKLVGTSAVQPALRALRASGRPAGLPLRLACDARTGRVAAYAGHDLVGYAQTKHERWLAALVEHGAFAVLLGVTGDPDRGQTHGLNIALVGLRAAIEKATRAAETPVPLAA